jgi:hypothetical protein
MEQAEWVILPQAVSFFCEGRLSLENGRVRVLPLNIIIKKEADKDGFQ